MITAVAFFNNKGGVGKTTLACNFAAYAAKAGHRTLVVDLDPQCNSTQLMLTEAQWDDIYGDPATSEQNTVMGLLRNIRAGDSTLDMDALTTASSGRFEARVLPGHPSLSIFEDILSEAWGGFRGGQAAGARRTMWLQTLKDEIDEEYDLMVVDVSPSLGAINRSALVGSDHFVTPMAADLFSLYALDNISLWFERWLREYEAAYQQSKHELTQSGHGELLPDPLPIAHGFVGYTVQQYVSRASGGEIRQIEAYDQHRREIPDRASSLVALSRLDATEIELGTIPNMFSMIPLAQGCHAPIAGLQREDGLRGAQFSQQDRYATELSAIFETISERVGLNPVD